MEAPFEHGAKTANVLMIGGATDSWIRSRSAVGALVVIVFVVLYHGALELNSLMVFMAIGVVLNLLIVVINCGRSTTVHRSKSSTAVHEHAQRSRRSPKFKGGTRMFCECVGGRAFPRKRVEHASLS
eukprot:SAG31_NODE_207_length_20316_cov_20.465400_5_plen_127_part_00